MFTYNYSRLFTGPVAEVTLTRLRALTSSVSATGDTDRPIDLDSNAELEQLLAAHNRVLVEFHTQGCSMCDAMQPVLGGVARTTDVAVVTMNPRDDPVLLDEYDVRSVPKLLYFEDGELVDTLEEGFVPTDRVRSFIGEE